MDPVNQKIYFMMMALSNFPPSPMKFYYDSLQEFAFATCNKNGVEEAQMGGLGVISAEEKKRVKFALKRVLEGDKSIIELLPIERDEAFSMLTGFLTKHSYNVADNVVIEFMEKEMKTFYNPNNRDFLHFDLRTQYYTEQMKFFRRKLNEKYVPLGVSFDTPSYF